MSQSLWVKAVGSHRAHIVLPQELIEEIDSVVGPRGRSAFLVDTARAELKRRQLLSFLRSETPAWNAEDHPELSSGTYAWVRSLRHQEDAGTSAVLPETPAG